MKLMRFGQYLINTDLILRVEFRPAIPAEGEKGELPDRLWVSFAIPITSGQHYGYKDGSSEGGTESDLYKLSLEGQDAVTAYAVLSSYVDPN